MAQSCDLESKYTGETVRPLTLLSDSHEGHQC